MLAWVFRPGVTVSPTVVLGQFSVSASEVFIPWSPSAAQWLHTAAEAVG